MNIKFDFSFKTLWLFVSAILLALPVFMPSYPNSTGVFGNVMNLSSSVLFIISFPLSLLSLPLSALIQTLWNVNANSIQGLYLQALTFFVMGYLQWFIVAPRVLKKFSLRKRQTAFEKTNQIEKTLPRAFDESGFTPLENVLNSDEKKTKIPAKDSHQ